MASKVSDKKSADNHTEDPMYVTSCFPVTTFKILPLSLAFKRLVIMWVSLNSSYLELVELLGCLYACMLSNLGSFPQYEAV